MSHHTATTSDTSTSSSTGTSSTVEQLRGWFAGRLPDDWFVGPLEVAVDRDEVTVVGELSAPDVADEAGDVETDAAAAGRTKRFRESTREQRMAVAAEAERRLGRKVAWGVVCAGRREVFTSLSVPVMTRLRQPERQVLDTLVEAGVARSRSEALAWSVKLVGRNTESWLAELREALGAVEQVRDRGPAAG